MFQKDDLGKPRYSLIPQGALDQAVKAMMVGGNKYGDDNWQRCDDPIRYYDAALRHIFEWKNGSLSDHESGLNPLAHAIASLMILHDLTALSSPSMGEREHPKL